MPMERPTVMMRTRRTILAALIAGLVLVGCSGEGGGGAADQGTEGRAQATTTPAPAATTTTLLPATTTTPSPPSETSNVPPPSVTVPPGKLQGTQIRVTGVLVDGVEPGCVLLDAGQQGPYLLIGGNKAVMRAGARVEVVGVPMDNIMSTCQQGIPLDVVSVRPA